MKNKKSGIFALFCVFFLLASSCAGLLVGAGAGAGVGTYSYIQGNLKRNYEAPLEKTWKAALAALEELQLKPEAKKYDSFSGLIKGKMADEKNFEITLKRITDKSTEVGIRIGVFGDRQKSEVIHDKIASNLR